MSFFVVARRKGRWVSLKVASLEMANEIAEQWKERGLIVFIEARRP